MGQIEDLEEMKEVVEQGLARRATLEEELSEKHAKLLDSKTALAIQEKGLTVLQIIAQQTQQNLEYHITSLVSLALSAVFGEDAPKFKAKMEIRRDTTECDLLFEERGNTSKPMESSGGGALDVSSFALRIAYWSLKKNRPTFLLDEPFKFVSPDLQDKVSEMVKMISEDLGIQIIMVSHADDINYSADKTFEVKKIDGIAKVVEL